MTTLDKLTYIFGFIAIAGAALFFISFTIYLIIKCIHRNQHDKSDGGDCEPKVEPYYATDENSESENTIAISDKMAVIIKQSPDVIHLILNNKATEEYGELVRNFLNMLIRYLQLEKLRLKLFRVFAKKHSKTVNNHYNITIRQYTPIDDADNPLSQQNYEQMASMANDDANKIIVILMKSELSLIEKD